MVFKRTYLFIKNILNENKCASCNGDEYLCAEVIQSLGIYERVLPNEARPTKRHFYNKILYAYKDSNTKSEVIGEVDVPCEKQIKELLSGDKIRLEKNRKTGFISYISVIKPGNTKAVNH